MSEALSHAVSVYQKSLKVYSKKIFLTIWFKVNTGFCCCGKRGAVQDLEFE